jgi:Protein of unknown function (DUF3999)
MRRLETRRRVAGAVAAGLLALPAMAARDADTAMYRYRAPVRIEQPAPFLRLPLGPETYAKSLQPGLADLRVVDAQGERVPFALLAPRDDELQTQQTWRDATLYRLPPRPTDASATWAAPVDLRVEGGRITVRQRGTAVAPERSPGWLIDLGERAAGEAAPRTLQLQWSGPAEFSAGYALEHGADLKAWQPAGGGQLVALVAPAAAGAMPGAPLTQPDVGLPADVGRFVRLVWRGDAAPPQLTAARAATPNTRSVAVDPPHELTIAPGPEPASAHAGDAAGRALHFDLGAVLPIMRIDLRLPPATRVLPVQVQRRDRADARWEAAAATVFYRIGDAVPPPLALPARARYLRLVVERVALPAADAVRLVVQAQLASLVVSAQGQPPLALLVGSAEAGPGALPLATLMPDADRERGRFGRASLGAWSEQPDATLRVQRQQRLAALKPWLLWSVLIGGVGALALIVWRLARGAGAKAAGSGGS